jgi:hypothetical protein
VYDTSARDIFNDNNNNTVHVMQLSELECEPVTTIMASGVATRGLQVLFMT